MRVGEARAAARQWVDEHAGGVVGYRGALFTGSTVGVPEHAELPAWSDVDVLVVLATPEPPAKPGKFRYRGVLLEISYLAADLIETPEQVLGSYHLAGCLRTDSIIGDPSRALHRLQAEVGPRFAEPDWVRRRCADALAGIERQLAAIDPAGPWHQQVTHWLFGTGRTAHVPLVAALRNPTVRLRYPAVRQALREHGQDRLYPQLLELLGCADLSAGQVRDRLAELADTFDAAAAVARTRFLFSSDITAVARPIAIDGSEELVDRGDHREAVFWIIATFARCHAILAADAPELHRARMPAFQAALADLGVRSTGDLVDRAGDVTRFLPRLRRTAEAILGSRDSTGGADALSTT